MNRGEKTPVSPYFRSVEPPIVETKSRIGGGGSTIDADLKGKERRKEGRKEGVHPLTREGNEFTAGDNSLVPN